MAQSLAREFGPKGVHVAHAVIDGVIDIPKTKEWDLGEDGKIDPNAVSGPRDFLSHKRACIRDGPYLGRVI